MQQYDSDICFPWLGSLRSSLFRFLSGKRESREGSGTEVTKKISGRGEGQPSLPFLFLLSPHAFARLPLGSRFLPLRGNGKDCYAGYWLGDIGTRKDVTWREGYPSGRPRSSPALATFPELFLGLPHINSLCMLVNRQLVCLSPVGIFTRGGGGTPIWNGRECSLSRLGV